MAKYCTNCGAELRPGSKFCLNCGEKVLLDEDLTSAKSVNDAQEKPIRKRRTTKKTAETKAEETAEPKTKKRRTTAKKTKPADEEPAGITITAPEGAEVVVSDEAPKSASRRRTTKKAVESKEQTEENTEPKTRKRGTTKKTADSDDSGSKFCLKCGAPLSADSKFCLSCGEPVSSKEPVSIKESTSKKQTGTKKKKKSSSSQPAQKKSHGGAFILLMVIVLGITGFVYPGFLVDKEQPPQDWVIHGNNGNGNNGNNGNGNNTGSSGQKETSKGFLSSSVESMKVSYSSDEVASSPEYTVSVSPENHIVSAGSTSVDFDSWNLPGEDTLIVHELPEKTDESGWEIKAYDFSLASGQDEFATEVTVTIPREADDAFMEMCLTYNEKTKQWEQIPYDISEDGSTYQIYTDHFSKKARAVLSWRFLESLGADPNDLKGEDAASDLASRALSSIYILHSEEENTMLQKVFVDYNVLKQEFRSDTLTDLNELSYFAANDINVSDTMTSRFCNLFGVADASNAPGEAAKIRNMKLPIFTKLSSNTKVVDRMTYIGMAITCCKMIYDARKGKNIDQILKDNIFGVFGAAGGAIGLMAAGTAAAPYVAAAVLTIYLTSQVYESFADRTLEPQEDVYFRYFYQDWNQESGSQVLIRNFQLDPQNQKSGLELKENSEKILRSNIGHQVGRILRPEHMSQEDYAELFRFVKENKYIKGVLPAIDLNEKEIPIQWALLMKKLYNMYYDRPEELPGIIQDFYKAYGYSLFDLGEDAIRSYYKEEAFVAGYDNTAANYYPDMEELGIYANNVAAAAMAHHADLHEKLMMISEHQMFETATEYIDNDLLPLLNTKIRFKVRDASLEDPDSFYKTDESRYAVDFARLKENSHLIDGVMSDGSIITNSKNLEPDYNNAITPMQFMTYEKGNGYHPVEKMAFYPYIRSAAIKRIDGKFESVMENSIASDRWYYPGTAVFLPRYRKNYPYVFECTYFHWLMMGSPTAMNFYDLSGVDKEIVVPFDLEKSTERASVSREGDTITVTLTVRPTKLTINERLDCTGFEIPKHGNQPVHGSVNEVYGNVTVTEEGEVKINAPASSVTLEIGELNENHSRYEYHRSMIYAEGKVTSDEVKNGVRILKGPIYGEHHYDYSYFEYMVNAQHPKMKNPYPFGSKCIMNSSDQYNKGDTLKQYFEISIYEDKPLTVAVHFYGKPDTLKESWIATGTDENGNITAGATFKAAP